MTWFMGIDIGSGTSKGVITENGNVKAYSILPSGTNYRVTAQKLRDELLTKAALSPEDITYTIATGRSAGNVPFSNQQIADIRCCAQGINHVFPSVRAVIDIQGQSTQVIRLNAEGKVTDFVTSEKCAAGSGRFLDIIANVLQLEIKDIGLLSLKSESPVTFTTGCAVFGESEAVSRVAEGIAKEDILAGVHQALAERISALVERVGLEQDCAVSGGGALNIGLVRKLEEKLKVKLLVPPQPQLTTALGAAIMAEKESSRLEHKPGSRHLR